MFERLFRGRATVTKEWVEGYHLKMLVSGKDVDMIVPHGAFDDMLLQKNIYQIDPETLGQGVGITDKNGKQIFEGDILNIEGLGNAVVRFGKYNDCHSDFNDDYAVGFYLEKGNIKCNILKDVEMMSGCEIIGNIHDNPELLEVQ